MKEVPQVQRDLTQRFENSPISVIFYFFSRSFGCSGGGNRSETESGSSSSCCNGCTRIPNCNIWGLFRGGRGFRGVGGMGGMAGRGEYRDQVPVSVHVNYGDSGPGGVSHIQMTKNRSNSGSSYLNYLSNSNINGINSNNNNSANNNGNNDNNANNGNNGNDLHTIGLGVTSTSNDSYDQVESRSSFVEVHL